jgi:hypothetical protein
MERAVLPGEIIKAISRTELLLGNAGSSLIEPAETED